MTPAPIAESPAWRDANAIRQAAAEVLAQPGYELGRGRELPDTEWVREWIGWLLTPLRLLFDAMEGLPEGFRWIIMIGLVGILVALVAHIIWSLSRSLSPARLSTLKLTRTEEVIVQPSELEAEAKRLAAEGDCVGACRRLLQAALGRLESIRKRRFRPGLTNTELLREYATTSVADPLRQLVRTIDLKWYGDEPCTTDDYEQCEASHARIRQATQERRHAVAP